MTQPHVLDHLVYGVPDLEAGAQWIHDLTGIRPVFGGRHATGTANYLIGLGDHAYLEIIGILPEERDNGREQPFQLEELTESRLTTWCLTTVDIAASVAQSTAGGVDLGQVLSLSRTSPTGELMAWTMTRRTPMADCGTVPFLIDWGSTPHPSARDLPQVALVALNVSHPHPGRFRRILDVLAVDEGIVEVVDGSFALEATLETPRGTVVLA